MADDSGARAVMAVMAALGKRLGLDEFGVNVEILTPTPGADHAALHFALCGAKLLLNYTDAQGLPAAKKRAKRRGARWVLHSYRTAEGQRATLFFAHALGMWLLKENPFAGEVRDRRERDLDLLGEGFPLDEDGWRRLDDCLREYRTFEEGTVPEEVRIGVEIGTGYHRALLEPEFADGRHPNEVPELLEAQMGYASRYFQRTAGLHAIEIAVGPKRWEKLSPDLVRAASPDWDSLVQSAMDYSWWGNTALEWGRFSDLAVA